MKNKKYIYEQVYLVDDNKIVNMVNEQIIKRSGITKGINKFTNPLEALEALQQEYMIPEHKILVLLDINMPEMNGFEFLEEASKFIINRNNFNIIMVTSSISIEDKIKALSHPLVCRYVTKPLTISKIWNFVNIPTLKSA